MTDYDVGLPAEVRGLITASKAMADQETPKGADLVDMSYIQNKLTVNQTPADDQRFRYLRTMAISGTGLRFEIVLQHY